jgi:hypothetical protein
MVLRHGHPETVISESRKRKTGATEQKRTKRNIYRLMNAVLIHSFSIDKVTGHLSATAPLWRRPARLG